MGSSAGNAAPRWVAVFLLLSLALAACSDGERTVTGLVTDVAGNLTTVDAFTLNTDEGERLVLVPDPDGDFDFPLVHLMDHLRTFDPVRVTYREDGEVLVAVAISDG